MTQARDQATETWDYAKWLTHAKNAVRMDAEIGLKAVEHLLGVHTAARLRAGATISRCESCGSYEVIGGALVGSATGLGLVRPGDTERLNDDHRQLSCLAARARFQPTVSVCVASRFAQNINSRPDTPCRPESGTACDALRPEQRTNSSRVTRDGLPVRRPYRARSPVLLVMGWLYQRRAGGRRCRAGSGWPRPGSGARRR
jgi:hypothetical protein